MFKGESQTIWFFFILIFFVAGCAQKQPLPETGLTAETFWSDQARRQTQLARISGRMTLHYEGNKENVTGKGQVLADLAGKLRIELRDPLGRMQYLALLSSPKMVAYYPSDNLAYLDNHAGERYLRRFLNIQLSFADLQHLFLGILPLDGKPDISGWDWDSGHGLYFTTIKQGGRQYTVGVDGKMASIRHLTIELPRQKIEVDYSGFKVCCGNLSASDTNALWLGQIVEIHHPQSNSIIEVDWKEVKPWNPQGVQKPELFQFQSPNGTRRISLD